MDRVIIDNWNKVVKKGDLVYHLGDFAFVQTAGQVENYRQALNGDICLIYGNHDHKPTRQANGFVWKEHLRKIEAGGQTIILCHYAMRVWHKSHFGSWCLYGHSHGNLPDLENSLSCDVGVDAWNFSPVSLEQLVEVMKKKKFVPINKRERE